MFLGDTIMGRIQKHNKELVDQAEYRAGQMQVWPSVLEEKMKLFLDDHGITYEFQKIFYIYASDGWISRYFIADFHIPESHIIIEVDGKFHDSQRLHDKCRTKIIEEHYPEIQILRYRWKDLSDEDKMMDLLYKINSSY